MTEATPRAVIISPKHWRAFVESNLQAGFHLSPIRIATGEIPRYALTTSPCTTTGIGDAREQTESTQSELSSREYQVLILMAEGMQNNEIAQQLRLAKDTVKTHVRHVLRKLGARARTQAVSIAHTRGLLPASIEPNNARKAEQSRKE